MSSGLPVMRITPRTKWVGLLAVALLVLAYPAYLGGRQLWGRSRWQAAHRALEERKFRQAAEHLKGCLAIWPDDPSVNLLAAQALRRGGLLDEAEKRLLSSAKLGADPDAIKLESS